MIGNSIISDDLAGGVIQDFRGSNMRPLEIWSQEKIHSTLVLTNVGEIVRGISGEGSAMRLFVSEYFKENQRVAFLDLNGRVTQESEMQTGELVFDGRFNPIVAIPTDQMFDEASPEKYVEIWNPVGNQKRRIRIDTKEWLRVLNQ